MPASRVGASSRYTGPPSMWPAVEIAPDHIARERKSEWAHEQPDHERRAADQLQASDQIGRRVGEGNAVTLEGAPLGVVADELIEREPEEGDAGRQSHGQRRLRQWLPRVEQQATRDVHEPRCRRLILTLRVVTSWRQR